jgi:hypothetical protein
MWQQPAVRMDRHQHAEAGKQRHRRGAAIADQRQRHAHHGQQPGDHAAVDHHVDEERHADGAGEQARIGVARAARDPQAAADDKNIQKQQQQHADQAPFLGEHREDEVGGVFGQEFELRLGAVVPALAEPAAGTDRDFRLDDVPAVAERIGFRVEEHAQAVALVLVHEVPAERRDRGERGDRGADAPPREPGEEHGEHAARGDQQRGAKVGLLRDQQGGRADQHGQCQQCRPARRQFARVQVPRRHHRQGQLDEFGRLEAHEPQVQPTIGAAALAEDRDDDQQQQAAGVQPRRPVAQDRRRHARDQQHEQKPEHEARALVQHQIAVEVARAVKRGEADPGQQHQCDEQRHIERGPLQRTHDALAQAQDGVLEGGGADHGFERR